MLNILPLNGTTNVPPEINDTSGQAHPYWYEWFVGLIEVVKLVNPDERIVSVAFQVASIKVWDDVVVQLERGRRCYQVKHSRVGKNLTFGALVQRSQNEQPLLRAFFDGWKESGLNDPETSLILYTNRTAGNSWASTDNGIRRPPLLQFWGWLSREVQSVELLSDLTIPVEYSDGWKEWTSCFADATESDVLNFHRALTIRAKEDDLDQLEDRIRASLSSTFGISNEKAAPLFDALVRALRTWTTGHPGVTVEALCTALTIPPDNRELAQAPPPPTPFFPTRIPAGSQLETDLQSSTERPVVFLTGEPGSGKTSLISWLANRRTEGAFQGIIDIRFFCFEPIRPGQPVIDPDSSRVTPQELWFSLLAQMRRGLEGRLHELSVPLRNNFLDWTEARKHVLRLADILGRERGRRFVISIDGIDHAARASQVRPLQISQFFASLPTPDELNDTSIRLLIAGQPPEHYLEQYPLWLQSGHPNVRRIDLPRLEIDDVQTLLANSPTKLQPQQFADAARLIHHLSNGNTLAIVFGVAESEVTENLTILSARLEERRLANGLEAYYDSIWSHAMQSMPALSIYLAGVISLSRTRVSPSQLQAAFPTWQLQLPQWNDILLKLGPLLIGDDSGYQIRHNDVRVFLSAKFQSFPISERRAVASCLADYYKSANCDRFAAHIQLFDLLAFANRVSELPGLFTVDWVIEGTVLGIGIPELRDEGHKATLALPGSRSWAAVVSVGCALHTLNRISYEDDLRPEANIPGELPPFLPTEASVTPLSQWTIDDLRQLTFDAIELLDGGDPNRARGLLTRWLDKLTVNDLVRLLPDAHSHLAVTNADDDLRLDQLVEGDFQRLGYLSGKLKWFMPCNVGDDLSQIETDAVYSCDKGFVEAVTSPPTAQSVGDAFSTRLPIYTANWELAVRNAAEHSEWSLVGELLDALHKSELSKSFLAEATWFALRSGAYRSQPRWLTSLETPPYGLDATNRYSEHGTVHFEPYTNVCRALGWTRAGFDPSEIAESVFTAFNPDADFQDSAAMKLLFRLAAVLGRIEGQSEGGDWQRAAAVVSPVLVRNVLSAAWGDLIVRASYRFEPRKLVADLAAELSRYCVNLGPEHATAAFEAALPFAEQFVLGYRVTGIWDTVRHAGRIDLLRNWTSHFLADNGEAWRESHYSARETVETMVPLAKSIGQDELAAAAAERAKWLCVPYQDRKEESFEQASKWFMKAAELNPTITQTIGWRLWQVCVLCRLKGGGNAYEARVLSSMSAAAIRCGPANWWSLISSTLSNSTDSRWHYDTRECLVEGAKLAIRQGVELNSVEIGTIWSIAVCFSYWFDRHDNTTLAELHRALAGSLNESARERFGSLRKYVVDIPKDEDEDNTHEEEDKPEITSPQIVNARSDDEFWNDVRAIGTRIDKEEEYWSYHDALLEVARKRAFLYGSDVVEEGLEIIVNMHARWIFGHVGLAELPWQKFPSEHSICIWDSVAVALLKVLLTSYSAEVVAAALDGMQCLVDNDPSIIGQLFAETTSEWSRRWLLNAAESWAVLYPEEVIGSRSILVEILHGADLDSALQAWIVLCRNCDSLHVPRVAFPLPGSPALTIDEVEQIDTPLLDVPPTVRGSATYANRFSAAQSLLEYCRTFGFTFHKLEGLVVKGLDLFRDNEEVPLLYRGPHRHDDFVIIPPEAEKAVGYAIKNIISADWCSQEMVADLCQALLPNEDSWIYRTRPVAVANMDWIAGPQYGESIAVRERQHNMQTAALTLNLRDGWQVFAAKAVDFTDSEDFVWHYWYESPRDSLLIAKTRLPTCPGGRTFIWWIGEPRELNFDYFVSGMFVGGRHRLCHSASEIRPPTTWRDVFGWTPSENNPLVWSYDGEPIAKYERIYRAPNDTRGPSYRRPFIDRWTVTDKGFEMATAAVGDLIAKNTFDVSKYRTD